MSRCSPHTSKSTSALAPGGLPTLTVRQHTWTRRRCPAALRHAVDRLAAHCLAHPGSPAAFERGATLTVRPPAPGTEWLGQRAAPDPRLDDPFFYRQEQAASLALSLQDAPHAAPALAGPPGAWALGAAGRPRGYVSLADAVRAAEDGDVIVLLAGTHPSGGHAEEEGGVVVDKRVLIRGQGAQVVA